MAEELSESLLKEKNELLEFLLNDKEFIEDIKNHDNVRVKEIFSYDLTVEKIFNRLFLYGSWNEQSRIREIIQKNYNNLDDYHTKVAIEKLTKMEISNSGNYDACDQY